MFSARRDITGRLVAGAASVPTLDLETVLSEYARIGFRKLEVWTMWAASKLDIDADPATYVAQAERHRMCFPVAHLPLVRRGKAETLDRAIRSARFAAAVGARIVSFKADTIETYIETASRMLDAAEETGITVVVQNHQRSAVETLEQTRALHEGIADSRMKALLEVGHFHIYGVGWKDAWDCLGERVVHVHVWDRIGEKAVPFGTGEIDLPGLFRYADSVGYAGDFLLEMEVGDDAAAVRFLADAFEYVRGIASGSGPAPDIPPHNGRAPRTDACERNRDKTLATLRAEPQVEPRRS
ncbi:MAG: sugar phosphate isomerase/epimerase [Kiritimatiellae bacterium]|nr:sugar phosphate isomerase/epimerase [Kiritimatiellia bacterium]